ncbi:family 16 glycosylhydrolase [Odoribacter sp. OttesenSCG-928-G04]|nr:family 16 glycosylhydrolase [Odoribacter sp. OttesenSCG-928-G04]MDL2330479.1 family 16 glycosylhydrolase [Odoribacter sp. OttesenSCG-928-A06]
MGLFSRGKKIRSTYEAETLRNVFHEDYELYQKIGQSEDLKRYFELQEYINSPLFKENKRKIEQLTYKGSEYHTAEKKFKTLLKNKKLRSYYIIKDSQELKGYLSVKASPLYAEYEKLNVLVRSAGFDKKLRVEEYLRYKELLNDEKIRAAIKFEKNKQYRHYTEICGTDFSQEFERLDTYIKTDEFKNGRDFLLNKKRYQTTDDYKLHCEYEELGKRSDILKYFSLHSDALFGNMIKWEMVFSDEFKGGKVDTGKWITRYYSGERFLDDTYGTGNDVQLYIKEGVELSNDTALLKFKKEEIVGKYWNAKLGMVEKTYEYTSGMLNTAACFRQECGRFEAKIKLARSAVKQSFWMQGDEMTPHVQIMENSASGLYMGTLFMKDGKIMNNAPRLNDIKLASDYYIFTLEWSKNKMVWKINDTVVREITDQLPTIPMYIGFSLGATEKPADKHIPASMEIDWVRCYKLRE